MEECPLEIKMKLHYGGSEPFSTPKGDWIDLCASEDVNMRKGEWKIIPLGISMQLPLGYEAHLLPRSSTYKKWGIVMANSSGIIDYSYCGDEDIWGFSAIAMRDTEIKKGDRICQFRIFEKQPKVYFTHVDSLNNKNRGGFGVTG